MSLHDQLLADLEDLDEEVEEVEETKDEDEDMEDVGDVTAEADDITDIKTTSVDKIAKLWGSDKLQRILSSIDHYQAQPERKIVGMVEQDPEYKLIVEANNITVEIDNEVGVIHKYVRDIYSKRFPELEQLVREPMDYIRAVKVLQNELDTQKPELTTVLAPATIMVVSVSATTTQGEPLSNQELDQVLGACNMALELQDSKAKIFDYVESKMSFLAPNVTHICGATTAAKLLGVAGGLTALSKMPACNILLVGAQKKSLSGFSAATMIPHTGFVFYSDIVQLQPPEYRKKCARLVSAKLALAARLDSYRDGKAQGATVGVELRDEILKKMDKAMEPPPAKAPKPLPRPDDPYKKKRGGKRVRRAKERYAVTEARKKANRMTFGDIQEDVQQTEMGFDLGQLGKFQGQVRALETKQKGGAISKRTQKRIQQAAALSGGMSTVRGPVSGTASVSFTPLQGLEIAAPTPGGSKKKSDDKYFGGTMSFIKVEGQKRS